MAVLMEIQQMDITVFTIKVRNLFNGAFTSVDILQFPTISYIILQFPNVFPFVAQILLRYDLVTSCKQLPYVVFCHVKGL